MPVDPVRDAAVDVLLRVSERHMQLDAALDRTLRRRENLSPRGRRFLSQLVYGSVRHWRLLDHAVQPLLRQPLGEMPPPMQWVLRLGVFQSLFCDQVTHPAMVHTSVDLARKRGHAGLAKLANAVLRRAPKRLEDVALPAESDLPQWLAVRYSLPDWLVTQWLEQFGEDAPALCAACNRAAPVAIRVNTLRTTPDDLAPRLEKAGFAAVSATPVPEELTLVEAASPVRSKLFQEGLFMVQDAASMLPAHVLEPEPGERVLELCAAPGGKTTHLAAYTGDAAHIIGLDQSAARLGMGQENAARLGIGSIRWVAGDGRQSPLRGPFDRVLLDAPCSGLGTLRRHPDLKWRLQPEAIGRLAQQQADLLRAAMSHCKIGGVVVYAVCTVTPQETTAIAEAVLRTGAATAEDGPDWLSTWQLETGQYRTLPTNGGWDGFFLIRLRR